MARKVTRNVDFHGCPMKKDDMVLLTIPAATRDPRQFPDADQVIIDRFPNRHIAFGASEHRCLGSHLARHELQAALREGHKLIPDYRLDPADPPPPPGGQNPLPSPPRAWGWAGGGGGGGWGGGGGKGGRVREGGGMGFGVSRYDIRATELVEAALAAEAAGFESLWLGEHLLLPVDYGAVHPTRQPEQEQEARIVGPDTELVDPLVALAGAAARTEHIQLATGIYLLPLRHPLAVARATLTLQEPSGGRLLLWVAAGWLRDEVQAP